MDIVNLFMRVHILTGQFPQLSKEELTELIHLSSSLRVACSNVLSDSDE